MTEHGVTPGPRARVMDEAPAGWDELVAADPAATPAHRPELWSTLARVLPGMRARFVAVEREGRFLGGAPAIVERRVGLHWIHALPYLLPAAPLAARGEAATVDLEVAEGLAAMQTELRAVGGEWAACRAVGPPVADEALARIAGETRTVETSYVRLDEGIERAWRTLPRDSRNLLRRARSLGLRFGEDPDTLDEAYALHTSQSRGWRDHRPLPLQLARRLLGLRTSRGPLARLFVVRDSKRLLGATLALDGAREVFPWWVGARELGRSARAMPFLFWSIAEWAADAGRLRVNLGGSGGSERLLAFKRSLGAESFRYPVRWMDASRGTWPARLAAAMQRRLRARRFRGEAS